MPGDGSKFDEFSHIVSPFVVIFFRDQWAKWQSLLKFTVQLVYIKGLHIFTSNGFGTVEPRDNGEMRTNIDVALPNPGNFVTQIVWIQRFHQLQDKNEP